MTLASRSEGSKSLNFSFCWETRVLISKGDNFFIFGSLKQGVIRPQMRYLTPSYSGERGNGWVPIEYCGYLGTGIYPNY